MEMEGGKDFHPFGETASRWASCLCLAYALAIRRSASGSTQWYLRSLAASDEEEKGRDARLGAMAVCLAAVILPKAPRTLVEDNIILCIVWSCALRLL